MTAPPAKPDSCWLLLGIGGAFLQYQFFGSGGYTGAILGLILGFMIDSAVSAKYEKRLADWKQQWMCLRCGHIFRNYPVTSSSH